MLSFVLIVSTNKNIDNLLYRKFYASALNHIYEIAVAGFWAVNASILSVLCG